MGEREVTMPAAPDVPAMLGEVGQAEGRAAEAAWRGQQRVAAEDGRALAGEVLGMFPVTGAATDRVRAAAARDDRHGAAVRFRLRRARGEVAAGWADRASRTVWAVLDMTR